MVYVDRPLPATAETIERLENEPWLYTVNGVDLTITKPHDPAQVLLQDPNVFSTKKDGVLDKDDCYICLDPEFAQMGLPLCYPCEACKANPNVPHAGHVPADDTVCTECGADAEELFYAAREAECAVTGHQTKFTAGTGYTLTYYDAGHGDGEGFMSNWAHAPATDLAYEACENCGKVNYLYRKDQQS